ncbi:hypothetical protein N9867_00245 [bacterium]|nr:hypothetical protein [bacterium]
MLSTLNIVSLDQGKGLYDRRKEPPIRNGTAGETVGGTSAAYLDERRRTLSRLASLAVLVLSLTTRRRHG